MNKIIFTNEKIIGEPLWGALASGKSFCRFTIRIGKMGLLNVNMYGDSAEELKSIINKGCYVDIKGFLASDSYQGADGKQKSCFKIIAGEVTITEFQDVTI